jgi:porphobilinogen synthase
MNKTTPATELIYRPRRLRRTPALRRMVQETHLTANADLILTYFAKEVALMLR